MAFGKGNALGDDLVSCAMEDGFQRSLMELAKAHDNKTGHWLEAIQSEVMATLKGSLAECAGVAPDAEAVAAAVRQMENFFGAFRDSLEKE